MTKEKNNKTGVIRSAITMVRVLNEGTRFGDVNKRIAKMLNVADRIDAVLDRVDKNYKNFSTGGHHIYSSSSVSVDEGGYTDPIFNDLVYKIKDDIRDDKRDRTTCKAYVLDGLKFAEKEKKSTRLFGNIFYKFYLSGIEWQLEYLNGMCLRLDKYLKFISGKYTVEVKKSKNQLIATLQTKKRQLADLLEKSNAVYTGAFEVSASNYLQGIDFILKPAQVNKDFLYNGQPYEEYVAFLLEDIASFMDDVRKIDKTLGSYLDPSDNKAFSYPYVPQEQKNR